MSRRATILVVLIIAALASAWILNFLTKSGPTLETVAFHNPDYYMEDFSTLTMKQDGTPKNKLNANYIAHYPADDTTELLKPVMEFFRLNKPSIFVSADKGWVTADNKVILLIGNVELWEDDEFGNRILQVNTSEAQLLPDLEYAETEKFTTIISRRSTITGMGMRSHFDESRLEILNDVHTTIAPN